MKKIEKLTFIVKYFYKAVNMSRYLLQVKVNIDFSTCIY